MYFHYFGMTNDINFNFNTNLVHFKPIYETGTLLLVLLYKQEKNRCVDNYLRKVVLKYDVSCFINTPNSLKKAKK